MAYEELTLDGFIEEMKEVSTGTHSRRFCFVIGAGASRSSGIKSGQELVDIWDKRLSKRNPAEYLRWKEERQITEQNKYSFYSHFYEKLYKRNPTDGYNYLEKLMERATPASGYVMLAHLLANTEHNIVITTNFDHLIEDAVNYYIQNIPLVIGHESLAHYISRNLKRPTVIKIHRDLLFDPASTVDAVETLHENWKKALNIIFSEYHPIFIGYAGNDNSLMDYLVEHGEKFAAGEYNCPYWMLYKTDPIEGKIAEFLNRSNGYFIRHDGFDEVLLQMGAAFDYKMPSEAEFMADANKRYKMLSDAIDAFSDKIKQNKGVIPNSNESNIEHAVQQIVSGSELQRLYLDFINFYSTGQYKEALAIAEKLVEVEPDNARYQNSVGTTLHELQRFDEAFLHKQKAVQLEPDNARYQNNLGTTLHEMKRFDEALLHKQKAVQLEPDNAKHLDNLSSTLHELQRFDEALLHSQKAVQLEPDNALYQNNLGSTLHKLQRFDEALLHKQKAVQLEPDDAFYQSNLGSTLHEMNRFDEALLHKQKAVQLEPDNSRYQNNMNLTLRALKQSDNALASS